MHAHPVQGPAFRNQVRKSAHAMPDIRAQMVERARPAWRASTRFRRGLKSVFSARSESTPSRMAHPHRTVRHVPLGNSRLPTWLGAWIAPPSASPQNPPTRWRTASASQATRAPMAGNARYVRPVITRLQWDLMPASCVRLASSRRLLELQSAPTVLPTPILLHEGRRPRATVWHARGIHRLLRGVLRTQLASAVLALKGMTLVTLVSVSSVLQASTKERVEMRPALHAAQVLTLQSRPPQSVTCVQSTSTLSTVVATAFPVSIPPPQTVTTHSVCATVDSLARLWKLGARCVWRANTRKPWGATIVQRARRINTPPRGQLRWLHAIQLQKSSLSWRWAAKFPHQT